ncbi:MAG: pimeloyl-ACP methyl ester carboxylesterase [Dinoroseobacter sp.]|jgi:pimeloyl-ACP methyl ester carboxylesterase
MTDTTINNGAVKLAVSVHGPSRAPNVLCLHGISSSRDTWYETVDRLRDRFRVWTLDFRGHGHSDRAQRYLVEDYTSDAQAVLDQIGQPTIVVGHSLGAIVAVRLAQYTNEHVRAVFLEDPPMYLNEKAEWDKTILSKAFPILRAQQVKLQEAGADFNAFVEFATNSLAVQGGVIGDHQTQRHLDSNGSALQRNDPKCWEPALNMTMLGAMDTSLVLKVPVMLLQADHSLGPALLAGHELRFKQNNPRAELATYARAPHRIHATAITADRFLDDLDAFVTRHTVS